MSHKNISKVFSVQKCHKCFSCQIILQQVNTYLHKNLKIGTGKHFELVDYPHATVCRIILSRGLWGSGALGGRGGPWQSMSPTSTFSWCLSSGTVQYWIPFIILQNAVYIFQVLVILSFLAVLFMNRRLQFSGWMIPASSTSFHFHIFH